MKEYASKKGWGKPDVWTPKNCLKLTKYGRDVAGVILCPCGEVARHSYEDGMRQAVEWAKGLHEADEAKARTA